MTNRRGRAPIPRRTALLVAIAGPVAMMSAVAAGLVTDAQTHQLLVDLASAFGVGIVVFLGAFTKLDKMIE